MEPGKAAQLLASTPTRPGIYLMKDAAGTVIYVGKAIRLRHRLRSYFGSPTDMAPKLADMMPRVADFEFIVTDTETEALLLENTLIKRHQPRYNIRLKDDKGYPYIKITLNEDWPRLDVTRRMSADGARYFGPFASASSLRKTMALLKRLFPYRSCTKIITGDDPRPCLEYYIHRCVGPCAGLATREEYRKVIDQVILFLQGKHEQIARGLKTEMRNASDHLKFERAAALRDQVRAIENVAEEQKAVSVAGQDQDIIALVQGEDEAWVEIFFIRQGRLMGRDHFIMQGTRDESDPAVLAGFIRQFYISASFVPPEVLVQTEPEDRDELVKLLEDRRGRKVALKVPVRGERRRLVLMVASNAREGLQQRRIKWLTDQDKVSAALEELQEYLDLERPPHRIETYDISNIQGTNAVGSMVVFEEGRAKPSSYRRFKIRTVQGADDYSMMREMLQRRFSRAGKGKGAASAPAKADSGDWENLPDLVLIDGGKGHLNAALQALLEIGIGTIPLASIAKKEEQVFIPEMADPIILPRNSQGLYLVQRMRDEAHRFAITYHRNVRSKKSIGSAMDEIPGIGPRRKKALLRQFGSVQGLREAPIDAIAAVPGMTRSLAEKVKAAT